MTDAERLKRIKKLDLDTIKNLSFDSMAMLTDGFSETMVKAMLCQTGNIIEQRQIIAAVKKAYGAWKSDNELIKMWGKFPNSKVYPDFLNRMQLDIECGYIITEEGTLAPNHAMLKVTPVGTIISQSSVQAQETSEEEKEKEKQVIDLKATIEHQEIRIKNLVAENEDLKADNKELEAQVKELEAQITELQRPVEELTAEQKIRMTLAMRLMKHAGMKPHVLKTHGNREKAARIMSMLLDIKNNNANGRETQTCATFISSPRLPRERYEEKIKEINNLLAYLEIDVRI